MEIQAAENERKGEEGADGEVRAPLHQALHTEDSVQLTLPVAIYCDHIKCNEYLNHCRF